MGRVLSPIVKRPKIKLPADVLITSVVIDKDGRKLIIETSDSTINIDTNSLVNTEPEMDFNSITRTRNGVYFNQAAQPSKPKVEKRYVMPADGFSLVDFTNLGVVEEDKSMMPKFVIGENYALGGENVEGFEQRYKLYNLVGMVDEFAGAKVDSLIVKQIGGEQGNIYTISKNDCAFLGIEYQNGLQLFSKGLSWKHVRNLPKFDEHNLGTSPTSEIDNTIRYVVLKLKGFTDYSDGYVLSPSGKLIKENQFSQSVQVITKEPVVYGNGHIVQDKTPLRTFVTHPTSKLFNHGNFISSEDEVFVLIELVDKLTYSDVDTFDKKFGVDPKYFEGLDPNEYFEVSWDELGGLTVEEYEEAKRKAAEEAARIAKEKEEEQKRLVAEAEKAAAEKAKLEALAVERMKKFKLREPQLSAIPMFKNGIDPIVGIDMYVNGVDKYLDKVENILDDLTKDLSRLNFPRLNAWSNAARQGRNSQNQLLKFLDEIF